MRVPISKYSWPEIIIYPCIVLLVMAAFLFLASGSLPVWVVLSVEAGLGMVFMMLLAFFRDPDRLSPDEDGVLFAPADGRVTDIEKLEECEYIEGPALRIGIFLSVFDVHINRSPCDARVEKVSYKRGKYKNAMNPVSSKVNENNVIWFSRTEKPEDKIIVRQISGAIARRIVCGVRCGQQLKAGQRIGMIKFGSRTELYVSANSKLRSQVKTGQRVKAGITAVMRYE